MKTYSISKSVKLLRIVLPFVAFIIFSIIVVNSGNIHTIKLFLIPTTLIFAVTELWFCISNRLEQIVIGNDNLTYKKMFRNQIVIWKDVKEAKSLDTWSTSNVIALKGEGINLTLELITIAFIIQKV